MDHSILKLSEHMERMGEREAIKRTQMEVDGGREKSRPKRKRTDCVWEQVTPYE